MPEDDGHGKVVPIASNSLGTLGALEVLWAYCRRCRRSRELNARALLGRYGDLHLRGLRRLRCTACGARDAEVVRSMRPPR